MSNENERLLQRAADLMAEATAKDPELWRMQMRALHREIYRAGAYAQLDKESGRTPDDFLARMTWLAKQDMLPTDVAKLAAAAENWRERDEAMRSLGGLTDSDLRSMVAEGFHAAFRKAVDHPYAVVIHRLIRDLPGEDWAAVLDFVVTPIVDALRRAAKEAEQEKGS